MARDCDETLEAGGFGLNIKAKGQRLSEQVFFSLVFALVAALGYKHHTSNEEMLQRVLDATAENTYVLSLGQAEREKLNIAMPESLRRKVRVHRNGGVE